MRRLRRPRRRRRARRCSAMISARSRPGAGRGSGRSARRGDLPRGWRPARAATQSAKTAPAPASVVAAMRLVAAPSPREYRSGTTSCVDVASAASAACPRPALVRPATKSQSKKSSGTIRRSGRRRRRRVVARPQQLDGTVRPAAARSPAQAGVGPRELRFVAQHRGQPARMVRGQRQALEGFRAAGAVAHRELGGRRPRPLAAARPARVERRASSARRAVGIAAFGQRGDEGEASRGRRAGELQQRAGRRERSPARRFQRRRRPKRSGARREADRGA